MYLNKEKADVSLHLPSGPRTAFSFLLTSMFRVSPASFIPFMYATFLRAFNPCSGLLVVISHRADSMYHLWKEKHKSVVRTKCICHQLMPQMFLHSSLFPTALGIEILEGHIPFSGNPHLNLGCAIYFFYSMVFFSSPTPKDYPSSLLNTSFYFFLSPPMFL